MGSRRPRLLSLVLLAMVTTSWWTLGGQKMAADISSPAHGTSPPPEKSPIKSKNSKCIPDAQSKEARPDSNSKGSSSGGSGERETATSAAAATAAALSTAAAVARSKPSSNGKGKGKCKGSAQTTASVAHAEAGDAATSSDSDGDGDEEEGGSTGAPRKAESEAGGVNATKANGHHGALKPTVPAGEKAGNGHPEAAASKAKVDEHAARLSDAAKAAGAAALPSATLLAPSCHPIKSKYRAPSCKKPQGESPTASAAGANTRNLEGRRGSEGTVRHPRPLVLLHPLWVGMPAETTPADVERDLAAAGFIPRRESVSAHSSLFGEWTGGNISRRIEAKPDDVMRAHPPPLVLPAGSMPCMVGTLQVNESEGVHRCVGTWAMTKADLDSAANIETRATPFEFSTRAGPGSFPHSGAYDGFFIVRRPPRPATRVEDELNLSFEKNSEGTWNVEGDGRNIYGSFTIIGLLDSTRKIEVYRLYDRAPTRSNRRASATSHASAAMPSARGGSTHSTQRGRAPKRGKNPRPVPTPSRAQPALPSRDHNDAPPASAPANDANTLPPTTTARRVKRKPSYVINHIGSDGNAHLSNGLRRCVTLLKALMTVRGKSEWFKKPVDHVGLNLFDYPDIIKRPMDLGTVRSKLESGKYQNTAEFAADVRLVFSNARLYNSDPLSLVHIAARDLFETFERRFAALEFNLDDPPSKRRKSNGGGISGRSNNAAGPYVGIDSGKDKKRKSSDGGSGKGSGDGEHRGGKSGTKKARSTAAPKAASPHLASAPVAAVHPAAVAPRAIDECAPGINTPEAQMERMQRRMAEMEAQLLRITATAAAAGIVVSCQPEALQKESGSASKRRSRGGAAKAKEGGGSRKGANRGAKYEKASADKPTKGGRGGKSSKTAAATTRAEAQARAEAQTAANAAVPMTFDEKKVLSLAINGLKQDYATRVIEIIQASMPLGSADEEIEIDIDSMDNSTLRELQAYIMELSASGSHQSGDADSDADAW